MNPYMMASLRILAREMERTVREHSALDGDTRKMVSGWAKEVRIIHEFLENNSRAGTFPATKKKETTNMESKEEKISPSPSPNAYSSDQTLISELIDRLNRAIDVIEEARDQDVSENRSLGFWGSVNSINEGWGAQTIRLGKETLAKAEASSRRPDTNEAKGE
jgi:hypothetical protein